MSVAAVSATSAGLESQTVILSCKHEIVPGFVAPKEIREAIFDFDGTVSLIRSGWQEVMLAQFERHLRACPNQDGDIRSEAQDAIYQLTGKNTIYQMTRLAEMVELRGGTAMRPQEYKQEYLKDLAAQVEQRRMFLRDGDISDVRYLMVPGAYEFLEALYAAGVKLTLASGTDDADVKIEAELLGVSHFFEGRIFGATAEDDDLVVAHEEAVNAAKLAGLPLPVEPLIGKARVISECLRSVNGNQLLGVGDGFVEIMLTKQAGGVALGIAGSEEDPYLGELDTLKLAKLKSEPGRGADIIVPDLLQVKEILQVLGFPAALNPEKKLSEFQLPALDSSLRPGVARHDLTHLSRILGDKDFTEIDLPQATRLFGFITTEPTTLQVFSLQESAESKVFVRVPEILDIWFGEEGQVLHVNCHHEPAKCYSLILGDPIMIGVDIPLPMFALFSCSSDDLAYAVLRRLSANVD